MANAIRFLAADAVEAAQSGHPGMPMGMADAATVLFTRFLKFDPADPHWPDRDRFVLSAGHGSMLLYSLLHLTGYADFPIEQLKNFRQFGARTAGHPEYGHGAGVETTTGPLGQGLANAVCMALAERHLAARFGDDLVDNHTYAIVGDGCLMEGISHEAASMAGHLGLSRLIVLFDDNHICIDGPTDLTVSEDTLKRFDAYGWDTSRADGHDPEAIAKAIAAAQKADKPSLIALRTTIVFGAPKKAGTSARRWAGLRPRLKFPPMLPRPGPLPGHGARSRTRTGRRVMQLRPSGLNSMLRCPARCLPVLTRCWRITPTSSVPMRPNGLRASRLRKRWKC